MVERKTLASIVTPLSEGGIGKIVVSGPDALSLVSLVFKSKKATGLCKAESGQLHYGYIYEDGRRVDEVILHTHGKQDSFTGEDLVEINCHGGIRVVMQTYQCLESLGAEGVPWDALLSQSLENGKLDFVQKEAIREIIAAHTKLGVKVLLDQYAGALSRALQTGLDIIEGMNRSFQSAARSKETSSGAGFKGADDAAVTALTNGIDRLLATASYGMALTTPQPLVILGKPNVGKSTIMNAILDEERALVHHEPGTTRDYISECISVSGIPFEIVDTAGIRDTGDMIESMSIEITFEQLCRARKVLAVFDNARPFDREDEGILKALDLWIAQENADDLQPGVRTAIPVINKCDLPQKLDTVKITSLLQQPVCTLSALNRAGLDDMNSRLVREFDTAYHPGRPVVFTGRQRQLLQDARLLVKRETNCLAGDINPDRWLRVTEELQGILTECLSG
ncbi:MAG TPA: GTPase [Candidatus Brocadiaceae bacterium]|nr:GTPase [Candidatus Brocadiaceae bacterium]